MFTLLSEPGSISSNGLNLFTVVIRHRVTDTVESGVSAVLLNVLVKGFVSNFHCWNRLSVHGLKYNIADGWANEETSNALCEMKRKR